MWTEKEVKIGLPALTVRHAGKNYRGVLAGDRGQFAKVIIFRHRDDWQSWEWSWGAIVRSLNTHAPLTT